MRDGWLESVLVMLIALCWLIAAGGCGYTEAEMQVMRDRADQLERALQLSQQSGQDYLDKFEATLRRCSADAGVP